MTQELVYPAAVLDLRVVSVLEYLLALPKTLIYVFSYVALVDVLKPLSKNLRLETTTAEYPRWGTW